MSNILSAILEDLYEDAQYWEVGRLDLVISGRVDLGKPIFTVCVRMILLVWKINK